MSAALGPIHHVGYVVADLDAAVAELRRTLPLEVTVRETMEAQGVEAVMCEGGGAAVELIRPLDPEGAIARFMAKRGEGFHRTSRPPWTSCAAAAPSSSTSTAAGGSAGTSWPSSIPARRSAC